MDIGNALRRAGRDDITIRSIIAKTVKDTYEQDIDIVSVSITGNTVHVKTGNSIINSELTMMSWDIKTACISKLWNIWIKMSEKLRFRFS